MDRGTINRLQRLVAGSLKERLVVSLAKVIIAKLGHLQKSLKTKFTLSMAKR
jgi:hypothetical protein